METFKLEDYNMWFRKRQYEIPNTLYDLCDKYSHVTWKAANQLYKLAVNETLIINNENWLDEGKLDCGRGMNIAAKRFEVLLNEAEIVARKDGKNA